MGVFSQFINQLAPALSKDAQPIDALSVVANAIINIADDALTIHTSAKDSTYTLSSYTLATLAATLTTDGYATTTLATNTASSAMVLLDVAAQTATTTTPVILQAFTSPNFILFRATASILDQALTTLKSDNSVYNIRTAEGIWLDYCGWILGIMRYPNEPDSLYAERMINYRFGHNLNNIALENFFSKMGYLSTVTDTSPGAFSVNITLPTNAPSGFSYTLAQLQDALNTLKAAGVIASVFINSGLTDSVAIADALSYTLTNSAWTWGNFVWGQFNW